MTYTKWPGAVWSERFLRRCPVGLRKALLRGMRRDLKFATSRDVERGWPYVYPKLMEIFGERGW